MITSIEPSSNSFECDWVWGNVLASVFVGSSLSIKLDTMHTGFASSCSLSRDSLVETWGNALTLLCLYWRDIQIGPGQRLLGSSAGAAHLLQGNAGVQSATQLGQKPSVEGKVKSSSNPRCTTNVVHESVAY